MKWKAVKNTYTSLLCQHSVDDIRQLTVCGITTSVSRSTADADIIVMRALSAIAELLVLNCFKFNVTIISATWYRYRITVRLSVCHILSLYPNQSWTWVHFAKSNPTQSTSWLTQSNPIHDDHVYSDPHPIQSIGPRSGENTVSCNTKKCFRYRSNLWS